MRRATPILRGNQAADEFGPGVFIFLWALVAALLVAPAIFVFHLAVGNEDTAFDWGMISITPAVIVLLLFAGMRSSARDTRQLRARGVPGTATAVGTAEDLEDGFSVILRIYVDGHEPFLTRARTERRMKTGETVEVRVDPSDRLFTIVDR
jgi:hypothetical protein